MKPRLIVVSAMKPRLIVVSYLLWAVVSGVRNSRGTSPSLDCSQRAFLTSNPPQASYLVINVDSEDLCQSQCDLVVTQGGETVRGTALASNQVQLGCVQ